MPETPLILTKFYVPPVQKDLVERSHLHALLAGGIHQPLILVSAPAGYGKSALVAEWVTQLHLPFAWLTLDEADNEPLRFFLYFAAALQKADPSIGTEWMALLQANQLPPQETLLTLLVNDLLGMKFELVCVLDDFHSIQDAFILATLLKLITLQPPTFHLVMITREDPALPLGRLRAHNQLTEIRANDLRFSKDETRHLFLDLMGIRLSDRDLSSLEERTEGWVVGLKLAGLSMRGSKDPSLIISSLNGNHRHILSYLTEEVLKIQPARLQEFLLQTSILTKLNAELCNAVTGQTDGAEILERLFSSNLFIIPLDDEGLWYRYHHLFADLLVSQLKRSQPERVKELHARASRWYECQSMAQDAIDHALTGEDFGRAMPLLEEHTWVLLNQGYVSRIEAWMQVIPAEWHTQSPRTNLGFAWMYMLRGNFPRVVPYLQRAESALENRQDSKENANMRAECLALRANLLQAQGKITESIEAAQRSIQLADPADARLLGLAYLGLGAGYRQAVDFDRAVDALQRAVHASRVSGDAVTGALATTHLVLMSIQHGRLRFAAEVSSQILKWTESSNAAPPPIIGAVYGALGLVYYEWGQIEQARDYFLRGIHWGTFLGHNASLIYTKLNLVRLLQAEGDFDNASQTMREAAELVQAGAPGWLKPLLIAQQANLYLAEHNLVEAESVLRQGGITPETQAAHASDVIHLAWLRLLLRRGKAADAQQGIRLARQILSLAESGQRNATALQAWILGALLHSAAADPKTSLLWLERALEQAEPEGYIRVFVDEGKPLAALLQHVSPSAYVKKILAAFPSSHGTGNVLPLTEKPIEALTERELDVLRLLSMGLTYAQIAERLVVSLNTVRYHVKGIYAKLAVEKQVQAVERGRALGLF
jgi:LuxR family maltose regulon positive regulatory protein